LDRAKIGVVGLGTFGAKHARVLAQLPQVELVGVCSRSADRAKEVAAACDARRWCTDSHDLIQDPDIDAVDIVTEVARHAEVALPALQHGKHVFCEVLVTMSMEEMDRIIGALEAELGHFADCVIQNRRPALSTLHDARNALRVGLAIVESAEKGEAVHL